MRRYANETVIPISRSRGEIEKLLRVWGASQMQWSDDFDGGRGMLRFLWQRDGVPYMARFEIHVPTSAQLREECLDGRSGRFSQAKYDRAMERRGMAEHRDLALLLKAIFVAVDAGLITAEQVFLPFLEGNDGRTVSECILPQMAKVLTQGGALKLLGVAR